MDMLTATQAKNRSWPAFAQTEWPIIVGLLVLIIPTLVSLGQQVWSTEAGVHGPIVLATGLWLVARRKDELMTIRQRGNAAIVALLIVPSLLLYTFGRAFDFISLEVVALGGVLIGTFYSYFGGEALRRMWFPILYLGFVVPLPGWLVDQITAPLKSYISWSATELLQYLGYPIVREGVTLYIAQYQLLVEDACAGLNSIISLTAISLFYIYILHNASWRYSLFLILWIIPVAMLANLVRVLALVLITYYLGNEAAQGYLHSTAGLVMFATALLGIFAVDKAMTPVRNWLMRTAS
jgi:exosortase B